MAKKKAAPKVAKNSRPKGAVVKGKKPAAPRIAKRTTSKSAMKSATTDPHREQNDVIFDLAGGDLKVNGKQVIKFEIRAADKKSPNTTRKIRNAGDPGPGSDYISVPINNASRQCHIQCEIEDPHVSAGPHTTASGKLTITIKPITT